MLLSLFFIFGSVFAKNQIVNVPFPKQGLRVIVTVIKHPCGEGNPKTPLDLRARNEFSAYDLVCEIRAPDHKYDSSTPLTVIENFKFPETAHAEMKFAGYARRLDLETHKEKWGTRYEWNTPTRGSARHVYLCPKIKTFCFKAITGGIEFLNFSVAPLSKDYIGRDGG